MSSTTCMICNKKAPSGTLIGTAGGNFFLAKVYLRDLPWVNLFP